MEIIDLKQTMKAFRLHGYGGPEQIQLDEIPVPAPGPGQVLVEVSAVGVNSLDWKLREGYLQKVFPVQLPLILGVDFVGTVTEVGEGCSKLRKGDRVMSHLETLGAYSDYIVMEESKLARTPAALTDVEAATIPIPALTAWQALYKPEGGPVGKKVLIHGASGAVGGFAVQLAKAAGATLYGTASEKHREYVVGLGADEFIDYHNARFEDHVVAIDLVLDFVGGETLDRSWSVMAPNGSMVSAADPSITSKVPAGLHGYFLHVVPDAVVLEAIAGEVASGKMSFRVSRVFPRSELFEAIETNRKGGEAGRIIVNFREDH